MIQLLAQRWNKWIACLLLTLFYCDLVLGAYKPMANWHDAASIYEYHFPHSNLFPGIDPGNLGEIINDSAAVGDMHQTNTGSEAEDEEGFSTGPTQPEMQAFQSVNSNNMVDLFSGDFSYNIPLMDVGGYPVNLGYKSGISMDQEASWVGLGWNINPGTITRNLRGVPDDFNGQADTIRKVNHLKENKTIGVNLGIDAEVYGLPFGIGINGGVFYNNYKGIGLEYGANVSIEAGNPSKGTLTAGLSLQNNSQEGLSITPTIGYKFDQNNENQTAGLSGNISTSLTFNSRSGLKALQVSAGIRQYSVDENNQKKVYAPNIPSGSISFALPSYNPKMNIAYTSRAYSFTGKVGGELWGFHPDASISGYVSTQGIEDGDTVLTLPAFGYLNYQNGARNPSALLDFNREKEIPYREKPAVPNIGLPSYTYDVFSITGEGTGGMFRAYRGDIGYVYDHYMKSRDGSDAGSIDVGLGNAGHAGLDINVNHSYTQTGPWNTNNPLKEKVAFTSSDGMYEAAYFKNPGEKSIGQQSFYETVGGDDVVTAQLLQSGINDRDIRTSSYLNRYHNKSFTGTIELTTENAIKTSRDKRTQVISYLTAQEANIVGFPTYIENHSVNKFEINTCNKTFPKLESNDHGLLGEYFPNEIFSGSPSASRTDDYVDFNFDTSTNPLPLSGHDHYSIRWTGFIKAPETGSYTINTHTDDGVRLWLNDSLFINSWGLYPESVHSCAVNLVKDQVIKIKLEYFEHDGNSSCRLKWNINGGAEQTIPNAALYLSQDIDTLVVDGKLSIEKRINGFRKPNHISQIDVLNADGRKYVYGIPVYNFTQKEVSFSVAHPSSSSGNTVSYSPGDGDNSINNNKGQDGYYNCETTPAYAHSFLLTAILSTDYVDVTGDGISDDDMGDAIKFNYSKTAGIHNPFQWRTPVAGASNIASYNEGMKTDTRDDKANYVYGEKELWYLNSIESKNMIAVFILGDRLDLPSVAESGAETEKHLAKRLQEIRLYSKADYLKDSVHATAIKTVHFSYEYKLCRGANTQLSADSGKLTLTKIWFTYNGNTRVQNPYVFNYASTNPHYDSKAYDRWGNYKSGLHNPGSMTNAEYPYTIQRDYTTSNEDTLAANASAWTLDSIILPSGGRIKVQYESDDYAYVQNKRAMQMYSLAGLGDDTSGSYNSNLYWWNLLSLHENLVVYAKVNKPVYTKEDVYDQYIEGVDSIYFKLFVKMPSDKWGSGSEFVPCYASIDKEGVYYGFKDDHTIWFKIRGVNKAGDGPGSESPLAKAALQFLRLNLPSKAYPGSDVGDDLNLATAVRVIGALSNNITETINGFALNAKKNLWASTIDPDKSMVRLDNPDYKKYGGGLRVKKIMIYDNWNKATGQKESVYGQQYSYTTIKEIHGRKMVVSSGVASYEPMIGGEENPWRVPIQYKEQAAILGPTTLGYTEEPLGESFFPSASVGYSKVRVRSINTTNRRSANGYEETCFYTTYDFPTITDRSVIDNNTKKRFKPALANFLRISAKHYLAISQGFKIELNDMNGKMRSQATYPETDSINYISYTENFYKVDDQKTDFKHLSNNVWTINPDGIIDTTTVIGKDVELMMDMREQYSLSQGFNFSPNIDIFLIGFFPGFFPTLIPLPQSEENIFHSVGTTKIIQRYGILDSVVHVEKGSIVSTKNMLYDSETGDVLVTRTQNEFNDPVYNFNYPSHWAYDGMGEAYKNIQATFNHIELTDGLITGGMVPGDEVNYFTGGDEIMVASKEKTGGDVCSGADIATFPSYNKIWAIDTSITGGGEKGIFFVDADGHPFTGNDVSMKIIRSGRRNINTSVGNITLLKNPLIFHDDISGKYYSLEFDTTSKVINASSTEFKEFWQAPDRRKQALFQTCTAVDYPDCPLGRSTTCTCECLKKLFSYLIEHNSLFIAQGDSVRVDTLVNRANAAGYDISVDDCGILSGNATGIFYASTFDTSGTAYHAHIGNCLVSIKSTTSNPVIFTHLLTGDCGSSDTLNLIQLNHQPVQGGSNDTVNATITTNRSMIYYWMGSTASYTHDTTLHKIMTEYPLRFNADSNRHAKTIVSFDGLNSIPSNATVFSANLISTRATGNHWTGFSGPMTYTSAGTATHGFYMKYCDKSNWIYSTTLDTINAHISYYSVHSIFVYKNSSYSSYTTSVQPFFYNNSGSQRQSFSTLVYEEGVSAHDLDTNHFSTFSDSANRPYISVKYLPYDTAVAATLQVDSCLSCSYSTICISAITDTTINPYRVGLLGNFRNYRSYVFYTDRKETDPTAPTNIRSNGTYNYFDPFWKFYQSRLRKEADTTFWVWNSETTQFNQKGFELENKDPLGRYNSGQYGYNLTLPVAVVQNSKYREEGFEGFEDYAYTIGVCDTACAASYRQLDYTDWKTMLTDTMHHTGKFSMRINQNDTTGIALAFNLTTSASGNPLITYKTYEGPCSGKESYSPLEGIHADSSDLVKKFSPTAGDSIVIGGWVREQQNCLCTDYIHTRVILYYLDAGGNIIGTDTAKASGSLVEGWQRFEKESVIPSTAKIVSIKLATDGQYTTFFDDLRIHPYNATMKSFVYDPVTLRLMAELDENNYATFYEYDDDGTLVRVKKETKRGIKTIKETRSVLTKNQ